jgi:hypothetical protein
VSLTEDKIESNRNVQIIFTVFTYLVEYKYKRVSNGRDTSLSNLGDCDSEHSTPQIFSDLYSASPSSYAKTYYHLLTPHST